MCGLCQLLPTHLKLFGILSDVVDAAYAFGITDNFAGIFYLIPTVGIDIANFIGNNTFFETI